MTRVERYGGEADENDSAMDIHRSQARLLLYTLTTAKQAVKKGKVGRLAGEREGTSPRYLLRALLHPK